MGFGLEKDGEILYDWEERAKTSVMEKNNTEEWRKRAFGLEKKKGRKDIRKILQLTFIFIFLLGTLAGCTKKQEEIKEVSNPMKEVEGNQAFREVGAYIEVPAGAQDSKYYIVDKKIAEIIFVFNDAEYSYRSSNKTEDLEGETAKLEEDQSRTVQGNKDQEATVQTDVQGGQLALWQYEDNSYSLYTEDEVPTEVFDSLCRELMTDSISQQAGV